MWKHKQTTWMDLEGIMLSEKSQSRKATYCFIPFIYHSQNDKITEMELAGASIQGCGWVESDYKGVA